MPKRPYLRLIGVLVLLSVGANAGNAPAQKPKLDVPYVPTPHETVDRMLSMANVGRDDFLIDLGSGDGRIVITAAKQFGTSGFGVDIDPERIRESTANARSAGVSDRVAFHNQDLFETDISRATVLTMYLLPEVNMKLRPRLLNELRPGTRIVSHTFTLGDWEPDAQTAGPGGSNDVYFWIVPAKVEGAWTAQVPMPDGSERAYRIQLKQRYQTIEGSAQGEGRRMTLADPRLEGDRIAFTIADTVGGRPVATRLVGRVAGDEMGGTLHGEQSGAAAERRWRAVRSGR